MENDDLRSLSAMCECDIEKRIRDIAITDCKKTLITSVHSSEILISPDELRDYYDDIITKFVNVSLINKEHIKPIIENHLFCDAKYKDATLYELLILYHLKGNMYEGVYISLYFITEKKLFSSKRKITIKNSFIRNMHILK